MIAVALAALLAQTDPTPFWMPPPPPEEKKKKEAPPPKKKKKKPAPESMGTVHGDSSSGQFTGTVHGDTHSGQSSGTVTIKPPPERVSPSTVPKPVEPVPSLAAPLPKPVLPPPEPTPQPQIPAPIIVEPEPEPEPASELKRWTIDALFGAWGNTSSDGSGRAWDFTYGLRGGLAIFDNLEVELEYARTSETAGSPFVSASAGRNLAAARLFWVLGDRFALLLGGGGGMTITHTQYSLLPSTDPGATATGLDAWAVKPVIQITAAGRARVWRGLEARAEVSTLLRDGRVELLPLAAVGAAF